MTRFCDIVFSFFGLLILSPLFLIVALWIVIDNPGPVFYRQQRVLTVRPGITDYASIEYIDENILLAQAKDPDKTYIEQIMPAKIALNMRYINHPTVGEYFKIIFLTITKIIR